MTDSLAQPTPVAPVNPPAAPPTAPTVDPAAGTSPPGSPKAGPLKKFPQISPKMLLLGGGGLLFLLVIGVLLLVVTLQGKPPATNPGNQITPGETGVPIPTGGKLAFVHGSELWISAGDGTSTQKVATIPILENSTTGQRLSKTAFSSDGRLVGYIVDNDRHTDNVLQVMKITDGEILPVFVTGPAGPIYDFVWLPNSSDVIISYVRSDSVTGKKNFLGKLSVLGFPGTAEFLEWVNPIISVQVTPTGFIYFLDERQELWRVASSGGRYYPVLRGVASFSISPDGRSIAYERAVDGEIWVSTETGGNARQVTFTSNSRREIYGKGGRSEPRWSLDTKTILFTESGANYLGIGIVSADGTNLRSVEDKSISPKIKYDEFYDRQIIDALWISPETILFNGITDNGQHPPNLYILSIQDANYQMIVEDGKNPAWSSL
jgi:hypothetical protein